MTRTSRLPALVRLPLALALAGLIAGCSGDGGATSPDASATSAAQPTLPTEPVEISQEDAERIAVEAAGPSAVAETAEQSDVEGRPVWRVVVDVDGTRREITVDRVNGEVVTNTEVAG